MESKQSVLFGTINKCWHSHGGAGRGHGGGGSIPRSESHSGVPTGSPVGGNTCMSWIWALHRYPPCAPCHEVCQLCGSDRLGGAFFHVLGCPPNAKGQHQEPRDLQPQVLSEELGNARAAVTQQQEGVGKLQGSNAESNAQNIRNAEGSPSISVKASTSTLSQSMPGRENHPSKVLDTCRA